MFRLEFRTDSAAFCGDDTSEDFTGDVDARTAETCRILHRIAANVEAGRMEGNAIDLNGNTVGMWSLS